MVGRVANQACPDCATAGSRRVRTPASPLGSRECQRGAQALTALRLDFNSFLADHAGDYRPPLNFAFRFTFERMKFANFCNSTGGRSENALHPRIKLRRSNY
jgi:hypothetical protein